MPGSKFQVNHQDTKARRKKLIPTCFAVQKGSCQLALISENDKFGDSMKTNKRFALGIVIGAICGAVLAAVVLKLPAVRQTIGVYTSDIEIAFGRSLGERVFTVLTILGALAGAALGGSLAVSIRWFAVLWTLMSGIVIGGATMFFVEVKNVKYVSGIWQQSNADERAFTYLQCLHAIDRGITNQVYLVRFQNDGRMVLTNYVREMEKLKAGEYGLSSGTNAPAYDRVRRYLATHP
jgi:hypothetical protein